MGKTVVDKPALAGAGDPERYGGGKRRGMFFLAVTVTVTAILRSRYVLRARRPRTSGGAGWNWLRCHAL